MGEARRRVLSEGREGKVVQDSAWPLTNLKTQVALEKEFSKLGIDYSKPGFHDSKPFLLAEAKEDSFIDRYAAYVEAREYSEEELMEAQRKIEIASAVVSEAVEQGGQNGLCVVASGVLSRILDELGVWNYCAKSTLSITFPPAASVDRQFFYAIDYGQFTAPHAFVVAPPFVVVDTTLRAQDYAEKSMNQALPAMVAQRKFVPYQWKDEDIAAPRVMSYLNAQRTSVRRHLELQNPQMIKIMRSIPGRRVEYPGGTLDYVVTGIGGYSERLADLTHHTNLNGLSATKLFQDGVLPRLAK